MDAAFAAAARSQSSPLRPPPSSKIAAVAPGTRVIGSGAAPAPRYRWPGEGSESPARLAPVRDSRSAPRSRTGRASRRSAPGPVGQRSLGGCEPGRTSGASRTRRDRPRQPRRATSRYSFLEKVGPGAEAPGSVSTAALPQDAYAARRASMTTLSLAFRVLVRCPEQGLPAPNRSSPYRKSHLILPKQGRTRDPFTVQSNLTSPPAEAPRSQAARKTRARAPSGIRGRVFLVEAPGTAPGS